MIKSLFKVIVMFLVFTLLQVLLLNRIHLFGVASLFLYVFVIIKIPVNVTRSQIVIISFLLGLAVDIFTNTLGMHAAACTLAGFFREPLINAFIEREKLGDDVSPSAQLLGMGAYLKIVVSVVFLHHITLFVIESFSLFDPLFLTVRIVASVILTSLIILVLEPFNIFNRNGSA